MRLRRHPDRRRREGALLDLGRTQRLFTGPQRRAVIARDRECAWPSCHAPARWCEIHHLLWWDRDGGPTSVDLAALLCSFHHHEVHRRDLAITRLTDPPATGRSARRAPALGPVRYEFRDRTGRLVGERSAGGQGGREPPDQPALEWTTDPVTGMRVPAFYASQWGA